MWRSFPELPYMFVGSSVSRKECDEVFPNCHICSLDRQCRGKNVTKFSQIAIYVRWIVSVAERMWRSFPELPYMFVGSSVSRKQCVAVYAGLSAATCTDYWMRMDSSRDREAFLGRRRERYRLQRERETVEEREVRLAKIRILQTSKSYYNNAKLFYSREEQLTELTLK